MPLPRLPKVLSRIPLRSRYVKGDGDASPLFLRAEPRRGVARGVLLLHGLTGTPFEVKPLAEALHLQGFTVSAPTLAGHGSPDALAETTWTDWLATGERALDELRRAIAPEAPLSAPVGVVGFSTGGLLALRLARLRHREVGAIAVLAAPLRLREGDARMIRWLMRIPRPLRRGPLQMVPKGDGPDTSDAEMRKRNPGMPVLPLPALAGLMELGAVVRRDLPFITTPTLVAHGRHDHTVPFDDSLEIAGSLGAEVIERLWLERSFHLLGIDVERHELAAALVRFFTKHLGGAVPSEAAVASGGKGGSSP